MVHESLRTKALPDQHLLYYESKKPYGDSATFDGWAAKVSDLYKLLTPAQWDELYNMYSPCVLIPPVLGRLSEGNGKHVIAMTISMKQMTSLQDALLERLAEMLQVPNETMAEYSWGDALLEHKIRNWLLPGYEGRFKLVSCLLDDRDMDTLETKIITE